MPPPPAHPRRAAGLRRAVVVALLAPLSAWSSAAGAARPQLLRAAPRPLAAAAGEAWGLELLENPAWLATVQGLQVSAGAAWGLGAEDAAAGGVSLGTSARLGPLGVGVGLDRSGHGVAQPRQSVLGLGSLGAGVGVALGDLVAVGGALRPQLDLDSGVTAVDVGLWLSPAAWLGLGAHLRDAGAATRGLRGGAGAIEGPALRLQASLGGAAYRWQLVLGAEQAEGRWPRLWHLGLRRHLGPRWLLFGDVRWAAAGAAGAAEARSTRAEAGVRRQFRAMSAIVGAWLARGPDGSGGGAMLAFGWHLAPPPVRPAGRPRAEAALPAAPPSRRAPHGSIASTDARAIGRAVLAIAAALAGENAAQLCDWIASDGARLDVESADPPLSIHQGASRAAICADLREGAGPWARYLKAHGPAPLYAERARTLPRLFRLHGDAIGDVDATRAEALEALLAREAPDLTCRHYRVRAFEGLGGAALVEVRLSCAGGPAAMLLLVPEQERYRLGRLQVDHRAAPAVAPP